MDWITWLNINSSHILFNIEVSTSYNERWIDYWYWNYIIKLSLNKKKIIGLLLLQLYAIIFSTATSRHMTLFTCFLFSFYFAWRNLFMIWILNEFIDGDNLNAVVVIVKYTVICKCMFVEKKQTNCDIAPSFKYKYFGRYSKLHQFIQLFQFKNISLNK